MTQYGPKKEPGTFLVDFGLFWGDRFGVKIKLFILIFVFLFGVRSQAMEMGVGSTSATSGRMVPALNLGVNYRDWMISIFTSGFKQPLIITRVMVLLVIKCGLQVASWELRCFLVLV